MDDGVGSQNLFLYTRKCTLANTHAHEHILTSADPGKKAITAESAKRSEDTKRKPPPPEEKMEVEMEEEKAESGEEDSEEDEESDDPDKLWCICREPHDDRSALFPSFPPPLIHIASLLTF